MRISTMLAGALLGAGAMYLLDPEYGSTRRAALANRVQGLSNDIQDNTIAQTKQMSDRARGIYHETRAMLTNEEVEDSVLEARIRSELGHTVPYAGAISVIADTGTVILEGDVLVDDIDRVMSAVQSISGVNDVIDNLQIHQSADGIPALQYEH